MSKRTKQITIPSGKKQTKQKENPDSFIAKKPSWRFTRAFINDKWAIDTDNWKIWADRILPKLQSYETQTWQEIMSAPKGRGDGSKNHNIGVQKLCPDAKKLLEDNHYYIDEIFSLRLTGEERIFGILNNGVLDIVWYDNEHQICPVTR